MNPKEAFQGANYQAQQIREVYIRFAHKALKHPELYSFEDLDCCARHLERWGEHDLAEQLRKAIEARA